MIDIDILPPLSLSLVCPRSLAPWNTDTTARTAGVARARATGVAAATAAAVRAAEAKAVGREAGGLGAARAAADTEVVATAEAAIPPGTSSPNP